MLLGEAFLLCHGAGSDTNAERKLIRFLFAKKPISLIAFHFSFQEPYTPTYGKHCNKTEIPGGPVALLLLTFNSNPFRVLDILAQDAWR